MISWSEEDEKGILALKYLKDNGKSLTLPESGTRCMEFEIIDHLKANNFIMDLGFNSGDEEERKRIEDITGIRIKSIDYSSTIEKNEIRELLIHAIEKLS